jgi:hypothetical protein
MTNAHEMSSQEIHRPLQESRTACCGRDPGTAGNLENPPKCSCCNGGRQLEGFGGGGGDPTELALQLQEARATCDKLHKTIKAKKAVLSVDGRLDLHKIAESKYFQLRMNARALKTRVRD